MSYTNGTSALALTEENCYWSATASMDSPGTTWDDIIPGLADIVFHVAREMKNERH